MPPQIPPVSFSRSMTSRDAFGGFTFTAFKPKNIPASSMVIINLSLKESSIVFFQLKLLIYSVRLFIIRSENYLFHTDKDSNHSNDVDVSNALCCPTPIVVRLKNIQTVAVATVVMYSISSPIGFPAAAAASS